MGRNKYPEETLEKIITISSNLFMTKGYEQTSIQDILDETGLSKGGLYHHFKSKEDILEAVMNKRIQYVTERLHDIIQNTEAENGKEKLKKIVYLLATDIQTHSFDTVIASQVNPHFVVNGLQSCMKSDAPVISELIEEGMKDGSLQVEQPALCSEVFLMLLNYWINPAIYGRNCYETEERLKYLQFVMGRLGLDIIDENLINALLKAYV